MEIPAEAEVIAPQRDIEDILDKHPKEPSSLIPILQKTQEQYGYLPRDVIERISGYLDLPESKIYGVATFYAQFRFEPQGEHVVRICHGTACHVKGADGITDAVEDTLNIDSGETTDDGMFTLERVACLGCCSLAPVIMVDDTAHGNLTREKAKEVLEKYRGKNT
ncbi:MAG: NADH-quinone oxidoreductase subunit NuoE [Candidatus Thermoplasmatota archaeon]|nr:NADH-quinone oxidoreductase subunit NuoE [Candidatus Thermoplasmatota archaeon]MBS3790570.1 NADH-quinone oxidoreductase subunit NuoE [Candidatus Thermoplasmatota archaeon]